MELRVKCGFHRLSTHSSVPSTCCFRRFESWCAESDEPPATPPSISTFRLLNSPSRSEMVARLHRTITVTIAPTRLGIGNHRSSPRTSIAIYGQERFPGAPHISIAASSCVWPLQLSPRALRSWCSCERNSVYRRDLNRLFTHGDCCVCNHKGDHGGTHTHNDYYGRC